MRDHFGICTAVGRTVRECDDESLCQLSKPIIRERPQVDGSVERLDRCKCETMPRYLSGNIRQALQLATRNLGGSAEWKQRSDVSRHPAVRDVVVAASPMSDKTLRGSDFDYERRLAHVGVGCGRR